MKIGTLLLALAFAMPVGAQTLHDMAIQGQEDDLARKVTAKNIDSLDREEKTMLMVAAENGQTGVVRMLVRAGANPAIQDRAGNIPGQKGVSAVVCKSASQMAGQ